MAMEAEEYGFQNQPVWSRKDHPVLSYQPPSPQLSTADAAENVTPEKVYFAPMSPVLS